MPLYAYTCKKCGTEFEILVGVTSEKVELRCKKCGSLDIEKKIGTFSVGTPAGRASCTDGSCYGGTCSTGMCPTNL